jgi:hypothetical protein
LARSLLERPHRRYGRATGAHRGFDSTETKMAKRSTVRPPSAAPSASSPEVQPGGLRVAEACLAALERHIDRLLATVASTPDDLNRVKQRAAALGLYRLAKYVAERKESAPATPRRVPLD